MSKRDDDASSEMEEGMTTSERRRRRRRGAGLRIPSDNVPRRSGNADVVAPVPEDPALAVSIAYAFADEPSGPHRARVDDLPDIDDNEDATTIAPRPTVAADGSIPGGRPNLSALAAAGAIDDVVPDGRTRQMPAVNLEALGLTEVGDGDAGVTLRDAPVVTDVVEIDVDDADEDSDDEDAAPAAPAPAARAPAAAAAPAPAPAATLTLAPIPALTAGNGHGGSGNGHSVHEAPTERPRARPSTTPPPIVPPVRVTFRSEPATPTPVADEASQRATTDRDSDADEGNGVARPRVTRASTVALSEDDLEELLEATPPPQAAPKPPDANAAPVLPGTSAAPVRAVPPAPSEPVTLAEDDVHEAPTERPRARPSTTPPPIVP
ncbi:MAG TPA: hypothetical protein VM734_13455, partial [Kofleriaceae bacterium]|nr:hypothetical protein [Kofleriaceae bacterium]